jgi:hypothetical protein
MSSDTVQAGIILQGPHVRSGDVPGVHVPTAGQACLTFGRVYRRPRGMYVSIKETRHLAQA